MTWDCVLAAGRTGIGLLCFHKYMMQRLAALANWTVFKQCPCYAVSKQYQVCMINYMNSETLESDCCKGLVTSVFVLSLSFCQNELFIPLWNRRGSCSVGLLNSCSTCVWTHSHETAITGSSLAVLVHRDSSLQLQCDANLNHIIT